MPQNRIKKKETKERRTVSGYLGTTLNAPKFELWGVQEKKKNRKKAKEKVKNISNLRKRTVIQVQEVQRIPQKIEHKEEYAETNFNLTKTKYKEKILKTIREKAGRNIYEHLHIVIS